jgi:hypothetical protein
MKVTGEQSVLPDIDLLVPRASLERIKWPGRPGAASVPEDAVRSPGSVTGP